MTTSTKKKKNTPILTISERDHKTPPPREILLFVSFVVDLLSPCPLVAITPSLRYTYYMSNSCTIDEIKSKVSAKASQYGVKKVYLFGSYARGEASPGSDIDICIEKGSIRTLFELSGFCQDLEESLGNKVDLVTTSGLSGDFREQIEKDMVLIYG